MKKYRNYFIWLVALGLVCALVSEAQAKKKKKSAKQTEQTSAGAPVVNCPNIPDKVECKLDVGTLPDQSCKCECDQGSAGGTAVAPDNTAIMVAAGAAGLVGLFAVIFLFIGYKSSLNKLSQELSQAVEAIGTQSVALSTENQYRDWLGGAVQHLLATNNEPTSIAGTDVSFVARAIRDGILAWAPPPSQGTVVLVDRFRPPL